MATGSVKIGHAFMRRTYRILDMEYKPSELAEEFGGSKDQVLRLIQAGAPARKDGQGHYWIHGPAFVQFLINSIPYRRWDKKPMAQNECFCVACHQVVHFTEVRRVRNMIYGNCPKGHKTVRFYSLKPQGKDGKK